MKYRYPNCVQNDRTIWLTIAYEITVMRYKRSYIRQTVSIKINALDDNFSLNYYDLEILNSQI